MAHPLNDLIGKVVTVQFSDGSSVNGTLIQVESSDDSIVIEDGGRKTWLRLIHVRRVDAL